MPSDVDSYVEIPLAFIVDGDNASAKLIGEMLAEASKYGSVVIRRVYGDWTSTQMSAWKQTLQNFALVPEQQFANISGKNATDSAMIIDAMDILHGGVVKGFCIVSSDSDFTRLATRIREDGLFVMGIGESKTPEAFRRACHMFVLTGNLAPLAGSGPGVLTKKKGAGPEPTSGHRPPSDAVGIIQQAFDNLDRSDGAVHLAALGAALYRLDPAFDSRTYGKPKLVDLIQSFPDRFLIERQAERGPGAVYVKRAKPPA